MHLGDVGVYDWHEVEQFVSLYFRDADAQELSPIIDVAAHRFNEELELKDDDEGKHLSVVFRPCAEALNRRDGLRPITVASLFVASPLSGRPLITEIIDMQGGDDHVKKFFSSYVAVVLKPVISMYMIYGITMEAHQQNSSILFDHEGTPHRLLIRGYGDARAYSPLLERRGYQIKPYRYGKILSTIFDESIEPLGMVI